MPLVGIGEMARLLKVDPAAVRYAVKRGRIKQRPDKLFDSASVIKDWDDTTIHERGHNNRTPNVVEMAPAGPVSAEPDPPDLPLNGERPAKSSDYAKARAATQIYEARLKKLRYEEKAKSLVLARDVADAAFQTMRCLRDACMNVPSRVAAQVAAESSTERCYQILESEIASIFQDFAEGKIA
jgi:hypothetical protein